MVRALAERCRSVQDPSDPEMDIDIPGQLFVVVDSIVRRRQWCDTDQQWDCELECIAGINDVIGEMYQIDIESSL